MTHDTTDLRTKICNLPKVDVNNSGSSKSPIKQRNKVAVNNNKNENLPYQGCFRRQ